MVIRGLNILYSDVNNIWMNYDFGCVSFRIFFIFLFFIVSFTQSIEFGITIIISLRNHIKYQLRQRFIVSCQSIEFDITTLNFIN